MPFFNNLNTRVIEKDRFVPQTTVPDISDDTYFSVHPSHRNPELEGMVGGVRNTERGLGSGSGGSGGSGGSDIQSVGDMRQFSGTNALFS